MVKTTRHIPSPGARGNPNPSGFLWINFTFPKQSSDSDGTCRGAVSEDRSLLLDPVHAGQLSTSWRLKVSDGQ